MSSPCRAIPGWNELKRILVMTAVLGTLMGAGARAAEKTTDYSLKIRGFSVGVVKLTSQSDARNYAISAVIENTGFSRIFRQFSYKGAANGSLDDGRLHPSRYQEVADTGRRSSEALIIYDKGVPRVVNYTSPKPAGPDAPAPATQGGTVDPLTAIYGLLRDVPRDRACQLNVFIFDGKRRSRIAMYVDGSRDGLPSCAGRYERLEGFTPQEVSRHKYFDFALTYGSAGGDSGGDMLQVENVSFNSFYGIASIDRR